MRCADAVCSLLGMNAKDGTVSVIDPQAAKVGGTIVVKPALESNWLAHGDLAFRLLTNRGKS